MITLLSIVILIFSIIIHEISHGFAAEWLGDPTARLQGRLTLNPLKHIDPVGSIIVPLLTSMAGFTFGWAKPVEYNPYNLKNRRSGEVLIALAGPASNLLLVLIFSLIIRAVLATSGVVGPAIELLSYVVIINLVLAVFNLIPLPPLDGSKLFLSLLPQQYGRVRMVLEQFAPVFIFLVVFVLWRAISPIIFPLFQILTGVSLGA